MTPVGPRTSDTRSSRLPRRRPRRVRAIHLRYRDRLERFARRILARSSPGVAEDVVQEAMLRASRALRARRPRRWT